MVKTIFWWAEHTPMGGNVLGFGDIVQDEQDSAPIGMVNERCYNLDDLNYFTGTIDEITEWAKNSYDLAPEGAAGAFRRKVCLNIMGYID